MRKIYTIGETVYDVIFQQGQIKTGKAGGSMLNASVSLGRIGLDVSFISEVGNDDLGNVILHFLKVNNVDVSNIQRYDEGKTPVALAFLDEKKNARYSFYKYYPDQRLRRPFPKIYKNDIVLFGSFFAVNPEVRERVFEFVVGAKDAGAIVIYDPNIRHPKHHNPKKILPVVFQNFSVANIVRASHEDFETLFGVCDPKEAVKIVQEYGNADLIFTHSSQFVFLHSSMVSESFSVPKIEVLSTIGAGDNFNAGIVYAIVNENISAIGLKNVDQDRWGRIINTGVQFSQEVCKSLDNYLPEGFKP